MIDKNTQKKPGRPKGSKNKNRTVIRPTKAQLQGTLAKRFVPQFLDYADSRSKAIRVLRSNLETLKDDAGIDSFQKELIAKRIVFLAARLETIEVQCATGTQDVEQLGGYVQMANALTGLLKAVGLEKQRKQVASLQSYVKMQNKVQK